jgi:O-antigen/teichoic acid export membrane protein
VKYLLKNITREANFLSLMGNVTGSFFGIIGFAFLAHHFPPSVFGQWVLYISSAALIDMFRFGITNTGVIRHLAGADDNTSTRIIGSFVLIESVVTIIAAAMIWGCWLLFPEPLTHSGYKLFFSWYPVLMIVAFPLDTALVILQAKYRFDSLLKINFGLSAGFFALTVVGILAFKMQLTQLVLLFVGLNLLGSVLCMFKGWDGVRLITKASASTNKLLLDFGKYNTFTLIGTNLLRGADTLIISMSPLGTAAVALYSIPMKLTELQQIPLRSFVATAFPKMSKASVQGRIREVKDLFYIYSGAMTLLFAFISLLTFVFAEFFIRLVGGAGYLETDPVTGANAAAILRVFSLYGILLPLERMTGIGLNSVNKPDLNFLKVLCMVVTNIIGDLIAVFVFRSLIAVAMASVVFTFLGAWLGYFLLDRQLSLNRKMIFSSGVAFFRTIYQKIRSGEMIDISIDEKGK